LYVVENLEELLEGADANATYEADDIKVQVKTKAVTNIQTRI
jgi:hypothetical protein